MCEPLESRRLLANLAEFLNPPAFFPAPLDLNQSGSPQATAADTQERRDLIYLAEHVSTAELPVLGRVDLPLLLLYSRYLQGSTLPVGEQTVYDTSYGSVFSTDGARPHVQVFVQSAVVARSALEALGMEVTAVTDTSSWQVVAGYLPVSAIDDAAQFVGAGVLQASERGTTNAQGDASNQWETVSYADQLKRVLPTVDGNEASMDGRIEIGVISDSINQVGNGVADSQNTGNGGDLPLGDRVQILDDGSDGDADEGRAMAELIYDIGPEFNIRFHTGMTSPASMASAFDELREAGADIITDDISYFTEPVFQDGQIAEAVDNVYLHHGVLSFGSAGNSNGESYYGGWDNAGGSRFHEFAPGDETLSVTLADGEALRVYLQWSEPWWDAETDIDIELYNADLSRKVADSDIDNNPIFLPVGLSLEYLTYTNNTGADADYHLAFNFDDGDSPHGLTLYMFAPKDKDFSGDVFSDAYVQSQPGITGNHAAVYQFSMGAVDYDNPTVTRSFSSHGPNTIFFSDGGNRLAEPEVREKPDFVAADRVDNTFFPADWPDPDGTGDPNFSGTSAASPNAAAVAGLVLDAADARLGYFALSQIFAQTATGTGAGDWDPAFGEGLINALGAGLVARGMQSHEIYLELNPFGDLSTSEELASDSDTDRFVFAVDWDGPTTITITDADAQLDPGLILWNADTGRFREIDYNDAGGGGAVITCDLGNWDLYQGQVFTEATIGAAGANRPYTIEIEGPEPSVTPITLDIHGDAHVGQTLADTPDSNYFVIESPDSAWRDVTITLTSAAALDGVLTLYDSLGNELARRNLEGAGGVESITYDVSPSRTYYLRVGSDHYASAGDYQLDIDFELPFPTEMSDAEGFVYFHSDGTSHDTQTFSIIANDASIDYDNEVDSFFFACELDGIYTISVSRVSGDVQPVFAIYDAATGARVSLNHVQASLPLLAWHRYIVAVADSLGTFTGDVSIVIVGPDALGSLSISIGSDGMGQQLAQTLDAPQDSDFFRFAAPFDADGTLSVTVSVAAGLDAAAILFDAAGNELAKSYVAGEGADEVVTFDGVTPSTSYYLTVLSKDYATEGNFGVSVAFGLIRGSVAGTKFYDLNQDGLHDLNEPGLEGWVIYADENSDGQLSLAGRIEPDAYGGGTLLDRISPAVVLSAVGEGVVSHQVTAAFGWPTSTGSKLFNNDWTDLPLWHEEVAELRADFLVPVSQVSIDFVADSDDDVGRLEAYDTSGNLLESYTTAPLMDEFFETMTIVRQTADIAYVKAFGAGDRIGRLDRLVFGAGTAEVFDVTNSLGHYTLVDLPLATYQIREILQGAWVPTSPVVGSHSVELSVAAPNPTDLDFGNFAPPQIHGVKWDDLDGDSVHDADEPGLAGWTIYLDLNGNGQLDPDEPATRTNIQGEYWFAGLAAGSYVVAEVLPPNWVQTSPAVATECVSVDNAGNPAADTSGGAAITPDGRLVAFEAYSANLVPNDTNAWPDIFVFDRQSRTMERVSVDSAGQESNQQSHGAAISDDGRFVAFYSVASNLVPEDTNIRQDAFVFDRQTRTTERVSVDSAGNQANDSSLELSISGDGRFVAFESLATNLTPGDTNNQFDIFVFDRQTRATERVSVSSAGAQANNESRHPEISGDGRFVTFESVATNLVPGDTNARRDVFVFDRQTRSVERVSVSDAGTQANADSSRPVISGDGRIVAFYTFASNLVPGDTNSKVDIFVFDRQTRTIECVSVDAAGNQANGSSYVPALNTDGNFVGFASEATNLVPGDTNLRRDIFLFDRQRRTVERVSVDSAGNQADDFSGSCTVSNDGRTVAFHSQASNLVPNDTNGYSDVFVRSRASTYQATVTGGLAVTGLDFGNYQYGMASGFAFNDLDGNGLRDQGEPGLDGWEMFVDLDGDGTRTVGDPWDTVHAGGLFTIADIPPGTYALRHTPQDGWTPVVPADDYYEIKVTSGSALGYYYFAERELLDFGDAPAPYPTSLADDGPRHRIVSGMMFGAFEDHEVDGTASEAADADDLSGDDEDGIVLLAPLTPGQQASIQVTADLARLDAWVDFTADGDWADADERIFAAYALNTDVTVLSFAVPATAVPGATYARFRLSSQGVNSFSGPATDGEVEDYRWEIANRWGVPEVPPPPDDYGPMNQFGDRQVTLELQSADDTAAFQFSTPQGGAATFTAQAVAGSSVVPILALYNGAGRLVAVGGNGLPSPPSVSLVYTLVPGTDEIYTVLVKDAANTQIGAVELSIDTPTVPVTSVALNEAGAGTVGSTLMTFTHPSLADVDYYRIAAGGTAGMTQRLHLVAQPKQAYGVAFQLFDALGKPVGNRRTSPHDGEAAQGNYTQLASGQDYFVAVISSQLKDHPIGNEYTIIADVDTFDFGDAPNTNGAAFPTLLVDDGAHHRIVAGIHLGGGIDHEWDGHPHEDSLGDDADGSDDENGVIVPPSLSPGHPAEIRVQASAVGRLDAWVDWNVDGDWNDSLEHVFDSEPLMAGANILSLRVPVGAAVGSSFARFRFSTQGSLSPAGLADDGEVEDYAVSLEASGEIRGTLWHDINTDGRRENDELPRAGRTVFLDDNRNDTLDGGERWTLTDSGGSYAFLDVPPGNHEVAELRDPGWHAVFPDVVPPWVYVAEQVMRPVPDLLGPDEFLFNQIQIFDQDSLEPMDVFTHAALDEGRVYDIEIGPGGDVYVAVSLSEGHGQIVQFTYEGEYLRTITLPDDAPGYSYPDGFDVLADGSLLVPQPNNERILTLSPSGSLNATLELSGVRPVDAGVLSEGTIVFTDDRAADPAEYLINVRPDDARWLGTSDGAELRGTDGEVMATCGEVTIREALELADGNLLATAVIPGLPFQPVEKRLVKYDIDGNEANHVAIRGPQIRDGILSVEAAVAVMGLAVARNEVPYGEPIRDFLQQGDGDGEDDPPVPPTVVGTGRGSWQVTVAPGALVTSVDFARVAYASVRGSKFFDIDGDGVRDAKESGVAGATAWVDVDGDGIRDGREPSATTDANGQYSIDNVLPGTFAVREEAGSKWVQTYPVTSTYPITATPGSLYVGNDFGDAAATWQNPAQTLDTNADQDISPLDALLIINYLNEVGTGPLPPPVLPHTSPPQFLDTSGDGYVFPLDALLVINELNRGSDGEGETSAAGGAVPAARDVEDTSEGMVPAYASQPLRRAGTSKRTTVVPPPALQILPPQPGEASTSLWIGVDERTDTMVSEISENLESVLDAIVEDILSSGVERRSP